MNNILLLGASLESDNRGVNALGIGAVTILKRKYVNSKIAILTVGERRNAQFKIEIGGNQIETVEIYYFSKYEFIKSLLESYLYKWFKIKPKRELSILIQKYNQFYDVNEGDSFSDIYGMKRIIRHFFDSKLIINWNKSLIFLPQTIGPFHTFIGKSMGLHILKRLKKIYVRDDKANKFLNKNGISYQQTIDMAVYMHPRTMNELVEEKTVGININGLMYFNRYDSMKGKYNNYKEFITKLIEKLIKAGYSILLIPHTYNVNSPNEEDDLQAIKDFVNKNIIYKDNIIYYPNDYDAQELKGLIQKTCFFMGSRMHSCIAALSNSVPTIGLAYSYKFEGTFKMFNQSEKVLDMENLQESQFMNYFNIIFESLDSVEITRESLNEINKRQIPNLGV